MGVEDYLEAPVGVAVAATAVVLSPRVRNVVRRGLVYGVAGAMKAADAAASAAKDLAGEAQATAHADGGGPAEGARTEEAKRSRTRQRTAGTESA
jgi:hypothetical protein